MEAAVGRRLQERGLTLAVAESLTGGLVASRLVGVAGASGWFKGGVVSYASSVKFELLGVPEGEVISERAALAMAAGVRELLHADVGLAFTGVAGPGSQEGHGPGTVFVGIDAGPLGTRAAALKVPGDRERIRQFSAISGLDLLRRFLP
jgi:nicotinamide-nucleotide amidase